MLTAVLALVLIAPAPSAASEDTWASPTTQLGAAPPTSTSGDATHSRIVAALGYPTGIGYGRTGPIRGGRFAYDSQLHLGVLHIGGAAGVWVRSGPDDPRGLHIGARAGLGLRGGNDYGPRLLGLPAGVNYGPQGSLLGQVALGWGDGAAVALTGGGGVWVAVDQREPIIVTSDGYAEPQRPGGVDYQVGSSLIGEVVLELPVGTERALTVGLGYPSGITVGIRD